MSMAATAGLALFGLLTSSACSADTDSTTADTATPGLSASVGSLDSGSSSGAEATPAPGAARGTVEVVREMEHDPQAFTQGLELHDGVLYESTGMYGTSWIATRPLEGPATEYSAQEMLPPDQFGEGLAVTSAGNVWQLTWQDNIAYQRDAATLAERGTVEYDGEGWGLCAQSAADGERLIMSNGSANLTFRDPETFAPLGEVAVTMDGQPVEQLNELECVGDHVYANVWMTDSIIRIDPATGVVDRVWDLSELAQPRPSDPNAVLNGIAAVDDSGTFLVTGKLWPTLYEVRLQ